VQRVLARAIASTIRPDGQLSALYQGGAWSSTAEVPRRVLYVSYALTHACDVAQSLDLALPTAYRIQQRKQPRNGAALPDESKVMTVTLTAGRCTRT
jgi:hypothetical protein